MAKQRKRKDGRYQKGFRFNGKLYMVYAKTQKELEEKVFAKRQALESGTEQRKNPTLNEYYDRWTEARMQSISESTLHTQKSQFKVCAEIAIENNKTLGEMKLKEITADDIRVVQKALLTKRRTQTVNDAIAHLSHVFSIAVKERQIEYNPCTLVNPIKRTEERARDTTHRALTQEETAAFFQEAQASFYLNVYKLAINTGLRIGEIGALLPSDIKDGQISVTKTITRKLDGGYTIGDMPKTEKSRRKIPQNDAIKAILKSQCEINLLLNGGVLEPYKPIFRAVEGGLLMSTPINREIERICKRSGVKKFTAHAFRDTFATRCIESGINPRTVQELMGHADFGITMNLYGHVLDDTKQQAMETVNIAI